MDERSFFQLLWIGLAALLLLYLLAAERVLAQQDRMKLGETMNTQVIRKSDQPLIMTKDGKTFVQKRVIEKPIIEDLKMQEKNQ